MELAAYDDSLYYYLDAFTVEFMFRDAAGNISTETRNIRCVFSELPGNTDA